MKQSIKTIFGGIAAAYLTAMSVPTMAADLTVQVEGKANGPIYIALYDTEDNWKTLQRPFRVDAGTYADGYTTAFKDLPPGRYVVSLFIDENGNKKLDRNPVGVPVEPYGISRNAVGNFGPPGFDDAAIELSEDLVTTINLR
jgi:uncharacterized protein (DUF2141 family)